MSPIPVSYFDTLQCHDWEPADLVAHLHHAHLILEAVNPLLSELGLRPIYGLTL